MMKHKQPIRTLCAGLLCATMAVPTVLADPAKDPTQEKPAKLSKEQVKQAKEKHTKGALKLADEQDSLSADVQDLIHEQSNPKVIELLKEVEKIMADTIDLLEEKNTGGGTIASETEVIEKIFEAAKKKQQQSGGT